MKRDVSTELKELRLHGMVGAWMDLMAQGESSTASSKWSIEHLLLAEHRDRVMRSVRHQMNAAKFPIHRDLGGFDFACSKVDQALVKQLATLTFTDMAQSAVLIGGPGTGKMHLAKAAWDKVGASYRTMFSQDQNAQSENEVIDLDGKLLAWMRSFKARAIAVRPDRFVMACDGSGLRLPD